MESPKLEAELNLALSLPLEEILRNPVFRVSYHAEDDRWKLILLYQGSLEEARSRISFDFIPLLGTFAIITIAASDIPSLLTFPEVLYLELSRPLYIDSITGLSDSCFPVNTFSLSDSLTGRGTAIAILDSGVDYLHPDFRHEDGTTRILTYWDQTLPYDGENRYGIGTVFTKEMLDQILLQETDRTEPSPDGTGHGTHIAGICAGNGRASGGRNHGAAPEASLIVVKLRQEASSVFTDYANLMMAADFSVRFASALFLPLVINISYGSNDGAHDGSSLMERFLQSFIFYGKNVTVIATGNEGLTRRHSSLIVRAKEPSSISFTVAPGEQSLYLQLWKYSVDQLDYRILTPEGNRLPLSGQPGIYRYPMSSSFERNLLSIVIGASTPYQPLEELFLSISPQGSTQTIFPGTWVLQVIPKHLVNGRINLWLPGREATNAATGFLLPSTELTMTVPSTASNIISVSGYDSFSDTFAPFSGQGFSNPQRTKPDLCAPAVNILSTAPGGGYSIRTGTSMAAPFVSGAAALLMEWGIVRGNDPFLYGEKLKAALWNGSKALPAFLDYPNLTVGWGKLCWKDSLPLNRQ